MTDAVSRRGLLQGLAAAPAAALVPSALCMAPALAEVPGGVLRVAMTVAAIPNSNGCPDQGGEGQRFMGITLYDQLIAWDLSHSDRPSSLIPGLATSWHVDTTNPKRWHLTIREGVKFHDGHTLTADDVVFSFDRAFKRDAPWFDQRAFSQILPQVPGIADWGSEGDHQLWIETKAADGTLPYALTWLGIVHRGAWEAAGKDRAAYMMRPVGTGPWKMAVFAQRERAEMVRNTDYWNKDRVPKCERLVLLPAPDANARVAALRAGQVDFIEAPAPDAVASLEAAGFKIVTNVYPHNWMWFLAQIPGSPWTDLRLRQAVNLGVDRSGLKTLLGGLMLEGEGVVTKGDPWYDKPTFELRYDPDAARALMAAAGYGPNNPLRTKVAISNSGSGQMQPLAMNEFIQQNLGEIGIIVDLEVFEWQALIEAWKAGAGAPASRGCMALNISQGSFDPFRAFARILQSDLAAPNGVNWSKVSRPELDKLFAAAQLATDPAEQNKILATIHGKVVDDALFLFAAHDLNPRSISPKIKGFVQAQSWFQDLNPIEMG